MRIIFARHGNTFGPDQIGGEKIIMAGRGQNIPLMTKGRAQARNLAGFLLKNKYLPSVMYANHLIRTWEYAAIIRETLLQAGVQEMPLYLDDRLTEMDYGDWAGLLTAGESAESNQVIERFGAQAWNEWQKQRIAPQDAHWQTLPEQVILNWQRVFDEVLRQYLQEQQILVVTSQGNLSFLPHFLPGGMPVALAENRFKVKTGNVCILDWDGKTWQLIAWDEKPQ